MKYLWFLRGHSKKLNNRHNKHTNKQTKYHNKHGKHHRKHNKHNTPKRNIKKLLNKKWDSQIFNFLKKCESLNSYNLIRTWTLNYAY